MDSPRLSNVIKLQRHPDGVGALDIPLHVGRYELVTAGKDPALGFIGGDPYKTNAYTGLIVPSTPSSSIGDVRYLFMLARARCSPSSPWLLRSRQVPIAKLCRL